MTPISLDDLVDLAFDMTQYEITCRLWERTNVALPFEGRRLESAKWGLPVAHLALILDSMVDYDLYHLGNDLCVRFLSHLAQSKGRPITVGHFVYDDEEVLFLKSLRCIPSSFLFGPRNATVDSNELLGLVTLFRIKKHAEALDHLRIKRGPFYKATRSFSEPSPEDIERFSAIGQISAAAVVGHDVDGHSPETRFFVAFIAMMQMVVDHKLVALSGCQAPDFSPMKEKMPNQSPEAFLRGAIANYGPEIVLEALTDTGTKHARGDGVPKNIAEAVKWWQVAAARGHAPAQVHLGIAYLQGDGIAQDLDKSHEYFLAAAERGDSDAIFSLGLIYGGFRKPPQLVEALAFFYLARERGHTKADKAILSIEEVLPSDKIIEAAKRAHELVEKYGKGS